MKDILGLETAATSHTVDCAVQNTQNILRILATSPDFAAKMGVAFGNSWDVAKAEGLAKNWATGDFSDFPRIEIRRSAEINGARGAFAAAKNAIYLSQELAIAGDVGAIASVLLEEYGHYIDSQVNSGDALGDEGEIFAAIAQGKELSQAEISALKQEDDGAIATLDGEEVAIEQANSNIQVSINAPRGIRPNKIGEVTVTYTNVGQTDAVAPLISLSATGALLQSASGEFAENVQFLGINNQGAAGILPPGASSSFKVSFQPTGEANTDINFSAGIVAENAPIDWNSIKNDARPDSVPADAWDVIWNNFTGSVGNTAGQYQAVLADNATHLSQLGEYSNDVSQLLAFELQQAGNYGSITQRYDLGSLGRGSTFPFEITATEDSDGNVTVNSSGSLRLFRKQADGNYLNQPGDKATLTKVGNTFQLRGQGGGFVAFRPDGKLDFLEDTNSNRITATYTGNQLTRINSTNGDNLNFSYNSQSRISQVVDQAGRTTTYSYDPTGELLLSITDPQGTTSYTYNAAKALTSVTFADGTQTLYDYDARGRVIKQSLNGGAEAITFEYDSAGGVTASDATGTKTKLLLNDLGQIGQLQDALGRNLQFKYDADGNLIQQIAPGNISSNFTYDEQSNLLNQVDPLGKSVNFTYEPIFNQVQSVSDQRGNVTGYNYDDKGNLVEIEYVPSSDEQLNYPVANLNGLVSSRTFGRLDSLSNSTGTNPTVSYYDKNGKLITTKIAYNNESIKEQFNYDPQGNLVKYVNRRGQGIEYTYDDRELLIKQTNPDGSQINFTYDQRDNLISATDAKGTITQEFDSADRLTKITYPNGRFLQYTYDAGGRRTRMVDRDGFAVNYAYDSVGRLAGLTDSNGQKTVSYTYDSVGRLSREDNGNGTYTTYGYDAAGQLLNIVNYAPNASVNSRFDYTYDQLGRRTSMTTLEGTSKYGYDANGQLISVTLPDNRTIQYQYDAAGNRSAVTDNGVATSYETNSLNQYTAVGKGNYTYDADGNLISKTEGGKTSTYTYDVENRLVGVVTPDGIWSYDYDAFGNRIASTKNGQRTEYLLDPSGFGNVVGEYSNGNLIARYTHGLGLENRVDATNATAYYDFDAIGSTAGLTGGNGSYVNRYSYLPFGEDLTITETVDNFFKFVGEFGVSNDGSGLYYMRERSYDSSTGRFVSNDPIGIGGGDTNIRRYVQNNPLTFIDPFGLAGYYNKPLDELPSINQNGGSPIDALQDTLELELSHEHIRFDEPQVIPGYNNNKPVTNVGFGADGKLFSYDLNDPKQKSDFEKLVPNKGQGKGQFDDETLVEAIKRTKLKEYNVIALDPSKDNCQEWAERVRKEYDRIELDKTLQKFFDPAVTKRYSSPPPPPNGGRSNSHGEPHLINFDGLSFDFQAVGEFTLVKSASGDLNIQVRQQPVRPEVSVNKAVATVIEGKRIVLYSTEQGQPLKIDGIPTEISDGDSIAVGGGRIYLEGNEYTIIYPSGDQLIAEVYDNHVNFDVYLSENRTDSVTGLLGNNNKNPNDDIALRDGTVLNQPVPFRQLYREFGESWRITQAESLFDYKPGEDTNTLIDRNFPTSIVTIDDLNPADRKRAEEIVDAAGITDPILRANAILDIALTGDSTFLQGALKAKTPGEALIIAIPTSAVDDFTSTTANTPVTTDVLINDSATIGVPLSISNFDATTTAGGNIKLDDNGTPNDKSDDKLTYTPPSNFTGTDTFNYTLSDGTQTSSAKVTVTVPDFNLSNLNGSNGFVIKDSEAGSFSGVSVNKVGDFNGDKIDDIIVGAFGADPNGNNAAGKSYVIFGSSAKFSASIDPSTLNGSNGFVLNGIDAEGFSGGSVNGAGDINGDGFDDVIIGAFGSAVDGKNNAGKTYVAFGSNGGFPALNLSELNGNNGFVLNGTNEFDYLGLAVSKAGDLNDDGFDDLLVSAPGALGGASSQSCVIFGRSGGFSASLNLADIKGDRGFVINDTNGFSGTSVSQAGDINGDGIDDIVIGAEASETDSNTTPSESYVVFGSSESFPDSFNLAELNGKNGFVLTGIDSKSGTSVSKAGDINGDGFDDFAIAVSATDNSAGKSYLVFGSNQDFSANLDLSKLNGRNGFVVYNGIDGNSVSSVSAAGDINADGFDDLIIGVSQAAFNAKIAAGKSYIVFGNNGGFSPTLNLSKLDGNNGLALNGVEIDDLSGTAVSEGGDVNGDGTDDLIVGTPGSLFKNSPGKSYVVFGSNNFGKNDSSNPAKFLFNANFYATNNPDLLGVLGDREFRNAFEHFSKFGFAEGRAPSSFFASDYLTSNPDVAAAVANNNFRSGFEHFIKFGFAENRQPSSILASFASLDDFYRADNPDVDADVKLGKFSSGLEHLIRFGMVEGREVFSLFSAVSETFDSDFYLAENSDVADAIARGVFRNALEHFINFGMMEGRNPGSQFDNSAYLASNPDVAEAVSQGGFRSGFEHFMEFGFGEDRKDEAIAPIFFDTALPQARVNLNDTLTGSRDNDTLIGDNNDNFLLGDIGNDTLTGGGGNDIFVLDKGAGNDVITDFEDGIDSLGLAGGIAFDKLAIAPGNGATIISLNDEILASLNGIAASSIGSEDFILI